MNKISKIAVIGAGVVGLSTAVCIQNILPSSKITLIADKFDRDTLSTGAGGIFRPDHRIDKHEERVLKWCRDSWDYFVELASSPLAKDAGMQLVPGYHIYSLSKLPQCDLLKKLVQNYRSLTDEEQKAFPSKYKCGTSYATIVTDCRYYLPWLLKKFEAAGGHVQKKHIETLSDIANDFDVIVNCTGLGAQKLVNDDKLVPVRGQTIKVKAPWIKHFYFGDHFYIIPGLDYVTLGGVKDYGTWDMEVNQHQKRDIWENCSNIVPSLKNAEIVYDWVGLRPFRSTLCLESNIIYCNGKFVKVVNNYGHGGHGVTLSWGTAKEAALLVKNLIKKDFLIAKL